MIRRKNQKNEQGLAREKLLFQYTMALERADFAVIEAILQQAEDDAVLEQMIAEINGALAAELPMQKSSAGPLKFGSNHASNNHRHNGIYQTEDQNNHMSITILPKPYAGLESTPRRFPFALAAAVLAVILIGGLLATAQFGFNDDGRSTGGGLQNQTATLPASATPISHDEQGIDASPTLVDQGLQVSATPLATLLVSATPIFEATHPNFPYYNLDDVLCTAIVDVPPSANRPNASLGLTSRPGNTWTIVGGITNGTTVDILDQTNFPGGTGVWQGAPLNYYFVSSTNTLYPIQGWIQEFFVEFTSECPPLPVYEADYWRAGIESQTDSTVIQGGLPETLTPPDATAAAATQQSYYSDLSTAVAGTVEAMLPPTGTLIPTATSNAQAGNPSVRRENVVVTDAQITMTHFTEPVHLTVTGYHPDLCQYATVINQRQDETHITVEIYRELPREVGCFDELVDYEATIPLGIFPQAATYTVDINGYTTEFVVEGQAPTATFTTLPTQNSSLPSTGNCVLATIGSTPVNVRSAPTTNSTIVGTIFPDLLYGVVGRDANRTWWNINPEIPGAVSGWVSASVTRLGGNCSNVAVTDASTATTPTAPALPPESTFFAPPTAIFPPPTLVSPTPLPTGLITPTFCADC